MLSGYYPFPGESFEEINQTILNKHFVFFDDQFSNISKEAKDLISKMFKIEKERPSAKKVLQHPWFEIAKEVDSQNIMTPDFLSSLEKYQMSATFRKVIQFYFSVHKPDDLTNVKRIFNEFDTNGDGYITLNELEKGLNKLYPGAKIGKISIHK